jgi:hypothetical protein
MKIVGYVLGTLVMALTVSSIGIIPALILGVVVGVTINMLFLGNKPTNTPQAPQTPQTETVTTARSIPNRFGERRNQFAGQASSRAGFRKISDSPLPRAALAGQITSASAHLQPRGTKPSNGRLERNREEYEGPRRSPRRENRPRFPSNRPSTNSPNSNRSPSRVDAAARMSLDGRESGVS